MNILYLSGPMSGIEENNSPHFNEIAKQLYEKGYEVINPADIEQPDKSWAACMRVDIPELMKADTLALLAGWHNSKGAKLEVILAVTLGMPIVDANTLEPIKFDIEVNIRVQTADQPRGEGPR